MKTHKYRNALVALAGTLQRCTSLTDFIDGDGIVAAQDWLREKYHCSTNLRDTVGCEWEVVRTCDSIILTGKFTTRVWKYMKVFNARDIDKAALMKVIEPHLVRASNWEILVDPYKLWLAGEWGDTNSCYWNEERSSWENMYHAGALALKARRIDTGKSSGRCWVGFSDNGFPVVYNAYGMRLGDAALFLSNVLGLQAQPPSPLHISGSYVNKGGIAMGEPCEQITYNPMVWCISCGRSDVPFSANGHTWLCAPVCIDCVNRELACNVCHKAGTGADLWHPLSLFQGEPDITQWVCQDHFNGTVCMECGYPHRAHWPICGINRCDDCGERVPYDDLYSTDGGRYCQSCYDDRYCFCDECERDVPRGDRCSTSRGRIICSECAQEYAACEACGTVLDRREETHLCTDCARHYNWCEYAEHVTRDDVEMVDDVFCCTQCLADNFTQCKTCGGYAPDGEVCCET